MKKWFIAGLIFWLPIWATYFIVKFLVDMMDKTLSLLPDKYQPDALIGHHIPGLGLVFTLLIVIVTGLLVTNFLGKRLMHWWERLVARIPLLRTLHSAIKSVIHAVATPDGQSFRKVVLVEYPRRGIWSIAFQTAHGFNAAPNDEPTVTLFVPTTPNPTSGFLFVSPKKEIIELDMTIEEGFKMILSVGVVMPKKLQQTQQSINI